MESLDKALLCMKIIDERKAIDPVLLDVEKMTSITDYFIVTGGNSSRQVQAISRHVARKMRECGVRPNGIEGEHEGHWVLMDYGDVVIHIFYQPVREFYDLEGLWAEAPRVEINAEKS
ncbi:MAG: ribosome silencing factor [Deltaproteobacteria bacterium]|nr:ribosome silencing factor [Deltaproteobacteria bacterium]